MLVFVVILLLLTIHSSPGFSNPLQTSSEVIHVNSKDKWSPNSKYSYNVGQTLEMSVPNNQIWTDWYIDCTAAGYSNPFGIPLRFNDGKHNNLFALICCTNSKIETCSYIGEKNSYVMPETGYLNCFANDVEYMYWNNKGSIDVNVDLLSSSSSS